MPEAGSCHDCAKRTGANSLLFPEADRDQCLDRDCYQSKVAAHVARAIQADPRLIQISTTWGTHTNGVLGRGQYVEIVTKASRNGGGKPSPERKKCPHVTKAIVVEGGNCGHIVNVCADPACETHHGESRKAREAQERLRAEQRKQENRRKEELATRSRVLAAILQKVAAPLTKADLELVARDFVNRLPQEYRTLLSQRHSPVSAKSKPPKPAVEIGSALKNLDEAGYSRLLIEMSLLDAAHNAYAREGGERLEAVAKRYRVNVQKIAESVAAEFASKRRRREQRQKAKGKHYRNSSRAVAAKTTAT